MRQNSILTEGTRNDRLDFAAYAPASHAPAAEIEELAALLRPARALYTTHMRNEGNAVVASLEESFAAGRAAGVPVVISHHKTVGRENFGQTVETLPLLASAIARQEVGLDAYPYIASSTVLSAAQAARALKVLVTWSKSAPSRPAANSPRSPPIGASASSRRPIGCGRRVPSIG